MSVSGGSSFRHIGLQRVSDKACMLVSDQACRSQTKHVGFRWFVDQTWRSPMGLVRFRWVSYQECRSPMGLWSGMSVSDGSPIVIIFSWTRNALNKHQHQIVFFGKLFHRMPVKIEWLSHVILFLFTLNNFLVLFYYNECINCIMYSIKTLMYSSFSTMYSYVMYRSHSLSLILTKTPMFINLSLNEQVNR